MSEVRWSVVGVDCKLAVIPDTAVPWRENPAKALAATQMTSARVAELADAQDLGSCGETRGGSTPPSRSSSIRSHQVAVMRKPEVHGRTEAVERASLPDDASSIPSRPSGPHLLTADSGWLKATGFGNAGSRTYCLR